MKETSEIKKGLAALFIVIAIVFLSCIAILLTAMPRCALKGLYYSATRQHQKAAEYLTEAVLLAPNMPDYAAPLYCSIASEYYQFGQYQSAVANYDRALALNSPFLKAAGLDLKAFGWRAVCLLNLRQDAQAIKDCDAWIIEHPKYAPVYQIRGCAYIDQGQYEKAIADCSRAIELDPKFARAYDRRGIAYAFLKQYQKAVDDCSKAIELNPKLIRAYDCRGNAYINLEQYQKAVDDYTTIINYDPKSATAYYYRGIAYEWLKKYDLAKSDEATARKLGY